MPLSSLLLPKPQPAHQSSGRFWFSLRRSLHKWVILDGRQQITRRCHFWPQLSSGEISPKLANLQLIENCKFQHPLLECRSITCVVTGPINAKYSASRNAVYEQNSARDGRMCWMTDCCKDPNRVLSGRVTDILILHVVAALNAWRCFNFSKKTLPLLNRNYCGRISWRNGFTTIGGHLKCAGEYQQTGGQSTHGVGFTFPGTFASLLPRVPERQ